MGAQAIRRSSIGLPSASLDRQQVFTEFTLAESAIVPFSGRMPRGHEDDRDPLGVQLLEHLENFDARVRVQIAGRLIR
jgi:hypothetical protein